MSTKNGDFGNCSIPGLRSILVYVKTAALIETNYDLRSAVRFPLHLPVTLHAHDQGFAETQDISAGGVLIHCCVDYPVGSTIEFSICMPAQTLGAEKDVQVECVGRVVRSCPAGDMIAVGAIIDEYRFSR